MDALIEALPFLTPATKETEYNLPKLTSIPYELEPSEPVQTVDLTDNDNTPSSYPVSYAGEGVVSKGPLKDKSTVPIADMAGDVEWLVGVIDDEIGEEGGGGGWRDTVAAAIAGSSSEDESSEDDSDEEGERKRARPEPFHFPTLLSPLSPSFLTPFSPLSPNPSQNYTWTSPSLRSLSQPRSSLSFPVRRISSPRLSAGL